MRPLPPRVGLAAVLVLAACSDPNTLPRASLTNELDTITLWSLEQGGLTDPIAYSLNARNGVRTWDAGTNWEFLYSLPPGGFQSTFLPLAVLGLGRSFSVKPGLLPVTGSTFDQMTRAPLNGYLTDDSLTIAEGDLFFVRTAVSTCAALGVPLYGKIEVLDLDSALHTVTLRAVGNQNCGYRGLQLGIPKN